MLVIRSFACRARALSGEGEAGGQTKERKADSRGRPWGHYVVGARLI